MELMFDETSIARTTHPLTRRLRKIFYARKLTSSDFMRLHSEYWARSGRTNEDQRAHCSNIRRMANADTGITFRGFQFILKDILGMTDDQVESVLQDHSADTVLIDRNTLTTLVTHTELHVEVCRQLLKNAGAFSDRENKPHPEEMFKTLDIEAKTAIEVARTALTQ